jgi:spermidine/putrescine transport system permease protein
MAHVVPTDVQDGASPPPEPKRRGLAGYLLLMPGSFWLALFFLVPTVTLVATSFYDPSGSLELGYKMTGHVQNYPEAISEYWPQIQRSLLYALIATVACIVLGYPLAYAIAFKAGRFKTILLVAVIAPFFTSFLVRTLAWQYLLGDNEWVVTFLRWLPLTNPDLQLINTPIAVVAGLTYNFLPFFVLPLYASLEKIDHRLLEAAGDLYASPFRGFLKVTLPLSMPGVVAGTLLTFIPAAGDYINDELLGSPKTRMVGNEIQTLFYAGDYPTASALSVALMVTIVVLVAVYVWRAGTDDLV